MMSLARCARSCSFAIPKFDEDPNNGTVAASHEKDQNGETGR
jgi:hypothetical protein